MTETSLSISQIAGHWSRELPGMPPARDQLSRLLSAFWRGELNATLPGKSADESRHKLLPMIRRAAPLPGIRIAPSLADIPPSVIDEPDGGATVDLAKWIVLPAGDAEIDEATAAEAFVVLARTEMADYGEAVAPVLYALEVERDELARYCKKHGFPLPKFWFEGTRQQSSARAEHLCREWLKKLVQQASAPRPKSKVRHEALGLFPGLSSRGFDKVWKATVPPEWRRAGRKPSSR
ncbi:hypothetical protein WDZ92_38335 [Nostoc sp. NIES-2111]